MAIDADGVQTFTDAQLLALTRKAIADILVSGQSYGMNGRNLTRTDLPKLWDTVRILEGRIADTDTTGGIALGTFGTF